MICVGTPVSANRWDLSVERLVEHLGIVIESIPHRSGDCYGLATTDGLVLDVLASETTAFSTLDDYLDAIEGKVRHQNTRNAR